MPAACGVEMRATLKRTVVAIAVVAVVLTALTYAGALLSPIHIRVPQGFDFSIDFGPRWAGQPTADPPDSLLFGEVSGSAMPVTPTRTGRTQIQFRLFNAIPVRNYIVDVVPQLRVVPGGQSVGILVAASGVRVMGMYAVVGVDGGRYMPARDAGMAAGDVILKVGGVEVSDPYSLELAVNGGAVDGRVSVEVKRGERALVLDVSVALTQDGYKLGVYAKDNAAGVGTLTFWDPMSGRFGALGHTVSDSATGKEVPITDGRLVNATVTSVDSSAAGHPGEKIGSFRGSDDAIGTVDTNCAVGIYGTLTEPLTNSLYPSGVPVAMSSAVKEGPAKMLTVVGGSTIEQFDVEIIKVNTPARPGGKNMVIRVTDQGLLDRTGGIVQGMSGSPLIQNGMLVGAVTHVFVSDPSRGYGVFAEQMLEAAGLLGLDELDKLDERNEPAGAAGPTWPVRPAWPAGHTERAA